MKILIMFLCLCVSVFGQDWKIDKKDPNRQTTEHLIQVYDKFHDVTMIMTRPDDVNVFVGKTMLGASLTVGYTQPKVGESVTELFLVLSPETVSIAGKLLRNATEMKAANHPGSKPTFLNFAHNAEVVLIVNGQRHKLPNTEKPIGLDGAGQWRTQAGTVLQVSVFQEMVKAGRWELLVGDVVVDFNPKLLAKRVQPRLQALAETLKQ
jgi:hypothetical protein